MEPALIRDANHLRYETAEMHINDLNDIVNVVAEMSALVVTMAHYISRLEEDRHSHDREAANLELADAMAGF